MTKIYTESVYGEILPITAHYYFKKMEVFEILSSSKNLIEDLLTLNTVIQSGTKIGFEMGSLEDFRIEYNQAVKTAREKNKYPFKEWLGNKRELMLKEI